MKCNRCNYICDDLYIFKKHMNRKIKCQLINEDNEDKELNIENCKIYDNVDICEFCNNTYSNKKSLAIHKKICKNANIIKQLLEKIKNNDKSYLKIVELIQIKLEKQDKQIKEQEQIIKDKDKQINEQKQVIEKEIKIPKNIEKVSTFAEFHNNLSKYNSNIKGQIFEKFVKNIIKNHEEFNEINNVWLYSEIPEEIKQKYKMPTQDKGIDILIEKDDTYIPVQCKFTSSNKNITLTDLSTFITQTYKMNLDICYLFTNSYKIENVGDKMKKYDGNFFETLNSEKYYNF